MTKKQYSLIGIFVLFLVSIFVWVNISQRSTEQRSRATASTTLEFDPVSSTSNPVQVAVGQTTSFDVFVEPGNSLPSSIKLEMIYDPTVFQASASSFTINTSAFPGISQGPVVTANSILVSVSVGSDGTKAIQTKTKVGTLTIKALSATATTPTMISFGNKSQVLSVASTDSATENVLSTTIPAYVILVGPSATPTMIPTATTVPPTTIPSATPTPTKTPTPLPTATPTLAPAATSLNLTGLLHSIGNAGDNSNPTNSSLSNKSPLRTTRFVTVDIYDLNNTLVSSLSGNIIYASTSGNFKGTLALNNPIETGKYYLKIKESTHLRRQVPGIITITQAAQNTIPAVTLIAGDANNDNSLDIRDYNLMIGCYSDLLPAVACTDANKILTDGNDDGNVNQTDYNLFLREIAVQEGN